MGFSCCSPELPGELVLGFAAFILDNLEKGADVVHAAVSHGDDGVHGGDGVEQGRLQVGDKPWSQLGKPSEQPQAQCMHFESLKVET